MYGFLFFFKTSGQCVITMAVKFYTAFKKHVAFLFYIKLHTIKNVSKTGTKLPAEYLYFKYFITKLY